MTNEFIIPFNIIKPSVSSVQNTINLIHFKLNHKKKLFLDYVKKFYINSFLIIILKIVWKCNYYLSFLMQYIINLYQICKNVIKIV